MTKDKCDKIKDDIKRNECYCNNNDDNNCNGIPKYMKYMLITYFGKK